MSEQYQSVSVGATDLLDTILQCIEEQDRVPPQAELAALLGVTKRTVERWVRELRQAGMMAVFGRQRPRYRVNNQDRLESVRVGYVSGSNRSLPILTDSNRSCPFCSSQSPKPLLTDSNRSGGGGVHDHDHVSTTNRRSARSNGCATELGRFLAANGIGAAREFDQAAAAGRIDAALYLAWFVEELQAGTPAHRAVYLARLGAPEGRRVEPANAPSALDVADLRARYGDIIGIGSEITPEQAQELYQ